MNLNNTSKPNFLDTNKSWYNPYVNVLTKNKIIEGYPDGSFRPYSEITRAEFTKILAKLDKANLGLAPFKDIKGHWAEKFINQEYQNNRILGYEIDNSFRPDEKITRAEAVTILNRFYNRIADEKALEGLKNTSLKAFSDLYRGKWYYYEIVEAANSHDFYRRNEYSLDKRQFENWIDIK